MIQKRKKVRKKYQSKKVPEPLILQGILALIFSQTVKNGIMLFTSFKFFSGGQSWQTSFSLRTGQNPPSLRNHDRPPQCFLQFLSRTSREFDSFIEEKSLQALI